MDYVDLGKRVRARRTELNWTQERLAQEIGVSTSFIGHIERGSRKASLETIVSLCNMLKVSPQILLQDSLDPEIVNTPACAMTVKKQRLLQEVTDALQRYETDTE